MSFQQGLLDDLETISRGKLDLKAETQRVREAAKAQRHQVLLALRRVKTKVCHLSAWKPSGHPVVPNDNLFNDPTTNPIPSDENSNTWNIKPPKATFFIDAGKMDFSSYPSSPKPAIVAPWNPYRVPTTLFAPEQFNLLGPCALPTHLLQVMTVPTRSLDGGRPDFMCGLSRHWRKRRSKLPRDLTGQLIDDFYGKKFLGK